MKTKTAHRPKNIPTEEPSNIPEEPPQPSESVRVEFIDKGDPGAGTIATIDTAIPEPDEATLALQKQLADLKKSEELQKQYAMHQRAVQMAQHAQPPTREQKLEMWKQQGMDPEDARFLAENPQMVDLHDVTRVASEAAEQQGFERGTEAHRQATKEIFDQHLGQQQAQPAATDPAGFFQPPEATRSPAAPDRGSIYSAPVSRRDTGGYREPSPRQVKQTPEEQQIAAASGISDVQYAQNKLRMLRERAAGERD